MTPGEHAPDPREARSPAEFLARLQTLKDRSGLTYRELSARAEASGDVLPRSTVANMLSRPTLPREELLTAFVRACGVPPDEIEAWRTVRAELAVRGVYGSDAPDPGHAPARDLEPDRAEGGGGGGDCGSGDGDGDGDGDGPGGDAPGPTGAVPVWPGAGEGADEGAGAGADRPGPRSRIGRGLVAAVAFAGLVLAGVSVVAFLKDGHAGHPPRTPTAPAAGDVRIRVTGTEFCLGERRGTRTGQVHQLPCAAAGVPRYSLAEAGDGRWRIVSDHPDFGPGCSGIPSGGRIPDAAYEDSECGDPTRVESFALEAFGTPVEGYRIVPVGSATPGTCVTVVGDRSAAWARLAQAPCAPDAAGQLFDFDRQD
ncbi:helix-turn-helix domain-containing protein [Streptomyces sp. NPDC056549]|uniref:helix-turn-helix domain-containing protein n=1 Tax=Streptomyces sp. NPDC056549 TaxID=3345864 RepID=UPI0036A3B4A7